MVSVTQLALESLHPANWIIMNLFTSEVSGAPITRFWRNSKVVAARYRSVCVPRRW